MFVDFNEVFNPTKEQQIKKLEYRIKDVSSTEWTRFSY